LILHGKHGMKFGYLGGFAMRHCHDYARIN